MAWANVITFYRGLTGTCCYHALQRNTSHSQDHKESSGRNQVTVETDNELDLVLPTLLGPIAGYPDMLTVGEFYKELQC